MKICVLMGGLSKEREISLRSGGAVAKALETKGHEVVSVDIQDASFIQVLINQKPEAAFIALHGRFGEDGTIQGLLEWLKIPYTGPSVLASALCFDKLVTKRLVMEAGFLSPRYAVVYKSDSLKSWLPRLKIKTPLIVKPNTEGSTIGITRVMKKEALAPAISEAFIYDECVLVEHYIQGREITVGVLDGKAFPIVEIKPKSGFYDYQSKYTKGATVYEVPAKIKKNVTKNIQEDSQKIYKILQCEGAVRMDYMLKGDQAYFLEVNTIPGMTDTSLLPKAAGAVGVSFEDLCDQIVRGARLKTA